MDGFSVVLPAYNEGAGLRSTLTRLLSYLRDFAGDSAWELVIVDDGSSDETATIAETARREYPRHVRFLKHPVNLGLSAALESGAAIASQPITVVVDADLSYAPETIGALVAAYRKAGASCALASPYMRGGKIANVPFTRLVASVVANQLLSACTAGRVKTLTGMVRAYDTRLLCELLAARGQAEFNSWSVAMMLASRLPLVEVPAVLAWPEYRRVAAGRLKASTLRHRTVGVVRSAACLLGFERAQAAFGRKSGTFVPPELGDGLMSGRR